MRSRKPSITRRQVCAGVAGLGGIAFGAQYLSAADGGPPPVSILAAGSLSNALETTFQDSVDRAVQSETHGSARVAQMLASGQKSPDIVALADVSLFDDPLSPAWYAEFASNELVVAYNDETEGGRAVEAAGADHWYEPLLDGDTRLGRTDPNLDPLGYRTLFMLGLAARFYDVDELRGRITAPEQLYPEAQLVSQFETGGIDAAVTYRNMAIERGYDFVELPPELNFGSPRHIDEWYSTVTWTLPSGKTVRGNLISYGATVLNVTDATTDVFQSLVSGPYLETHGFTIPASYPRYHGTVPNKITD